MTLTGMRKHVGVLEQAELVTTEKVGRVRTCRLGPRRLGRRDGVDRAAAPAVGRPVRRAGQVVAERDERSGTMDTRSASEPTTMGSHDDRADLRAGAGRDPDLRRPARVVFEAWTKPELFRRWWVPKSSACPAVVRGRCAGRGRLPVRLRRTAETAFFGRYLEVTPPTRLVWTNEEGDEGPSPP